ncbi:hypothetical protein EDD37DRAFT_429557 [Exophiala viscosa]|uniref:uncharacterized protein n=1 Tax=Exophiala viscosa TaxID=2486360 RepID=UPI00218D5EA7|nr:hypothetical protein EDD37DRAFT_429557 [Exophiala viscosa]
MHTSIVITALVVSRCVCAATIQNNHIERDVSAISVDIAEMFSTKINSTIPLASPTDGLLYVPDRYLMYSGNPDSWPTMDSWLSFEKMWSRNEPFIGQSCANNVESNTADETATILAGIHKPRVELTGDTF